MDAQTAAQEVTMSDLVNHLENIGVTRVDIPQNKQQDDFYTYGFNLNDQELRIRKLEQKIALLESNLARSHEFISFRTSILGCIVALNNRIAALEQKNQDITLPPGGHRPGDVYTVTP